MIAFAFNRCRSIIRRNLKSDSEVEKLFLPVRLANFLKSDDECDLMDVDSDLKLIYSCASPRISPIHPKPFCRISRSVKMQKTEFNSNFVEL